MYCIIQVFIRPKDSNTLYRVFYLGQKYKNKKQICHGALTKTRSAIYEQIATTFIYLKSNTKANVEYQDFHNRKMKKPTEI
jgi:hypothetical protein